MFALGTYYETENQKEKADSLYQIIYDNYPKSTYFTQAAIKLGKIKQDEKKKVAVTDDPAEPEYIAAEELYYNNNFASAYKRIEESYILLIPNHPLLRKLFILSV